MSKAILVVDMPKNCEECKFYDGDCCYATAEKICWGLSCRGVDHWKIKEKWCPLKPMPSFKAVDLNDTRDVMMFCHGWNTCLNEITGETE